MARKRTIAKSMDEFITEVNTVGGGHYNLGWDWERDDLRGAIHGALKFSKVYWQYFDLGSTYAKDLIFLIGDSRISINNPQSIEHIRDGEKGRRTYDIICESGERVRIVLNPIE